MTIAASALAVAPPAPAPVSPRGSRDDSQSANRDFAQQLNGLRGEEPAVRPRGVPKGLENPDRRGREGNGKHKDTASTSVAPAPPQVPIPPLPPLELHAPWNTESAYGNSDLVGTQAYGAGALLALAADILPGAALQGGQGDPAPQGDGTGQVKTPLAESPSAPDLSAELAFAARVRPAEAPNPPESKTLRTTMEQFDASAAAARKAGLEEDMKDPVALRADAVLPAHSPIPAFDRPLETVPGASAHDPVPPTGRVDSPAPSVEATPKPVQPLKDLSLQVSASHQQKVEVRFTDQSGELRLSVRTADTELVHGLRQSLPELVGKLEETGFRAETWRPADPTGSIASAPDTKSASNHSRNTDSQSHSGWSQQSGDQRNHHQSNRPRWLEEMESSLAASGQL